LEASLGATHQRGRTLPGGDIDGLLENTAASMPVRAADLASRVLV
jgi:hypothetical protein